MDEDIQKGQPKQDEHTEHGMVYDQSNAQSYTSWSVEDRIAAVLSQGPFLNLVVENINALGSGKDSQLKDSEKTSPKVIFDIGCGSGEVMDYVIKRVNPVHKHERIFNGIDISSPMIEIAKEQCLKITAKNNVQCFFSIGDMHNLNNVSDHSVDFMYSGYVFQHSAQIHELFKHLSTKLKYGCKLSFVTSIMEPKDKSKGFPSGYLSNKWVPFNLPNVVVKNYGHTLTEWCSALEEAGFIWNVVHNTINIGLIDEEYIYKDDIEVREVIIDATSVKQ